jgi:serine/threonine protein kinase
LRVTTPEPEQASGAAHPAGSLIVNRYRLEDNVPLGTGGMGEVWRATDTLLNRVVALKQIRLTGIDGHTAAEVRQRTLHEGRVAARLVHPNIVTIFDVVTDGDPLWLALEYVPSQGAGTLLAAQGPFPLHLAAQVGAQMAEALATAHAQGVLHRDVTPSNILIDAGWNAKLTDFGISHASVDLQRTADTSSIGTPAFMAPEIARGENGSTATDVYGLGATIYALVEGTPPFHQDGSDNPMRLMHLIATGQVPAPVNAGPLTTVLTSMTNADPSKRPDAATARDMFVSAAHMIGAQPPAPAPEIATPPPTTPAPAPATQPPAGAVPPWAAAVPAPFQTSAAQTVPTRTVPTHIVPTPVTSSPGRQKRSFVIPAVVASVVLLIAAVVATLLLIPGIRHSEAAPPTADKYLPNPALADACAMAKAPDYALFGTVDYIVGAWFGSCDATIVLTGGGTADINFRVVGPQTVPGPTEQHGDLTVISPGGTDLTQCYRDIVLPDRNIIVAWTTVTNSAISPCVLSGLGTDAVVQHLQSSGSVPTLPNLGDASSLRRQNACQILTKADIGEVPGVDTSQIYPKYGNWTCYWGADLAYQYARAPWVYVSFNRENPLVAGQDGTPQNIAGRTVFVKSENGANGQTDCIAQIVHRRTTLPSGGTLEESANVAVHAAVPPDQQCHLATDLAAKLIPRLPAG